MSDKWSHGYRLQRAWLDEQLEEMTAQEALTLFRHTLASRESTLEPNPFNAGGDVATKDAIAALEVQLAK